MGRSKNNQLYAKQKGRASKNRQRRKQAGERAALRSASSRRGTNGALGFAGVMDTGSPNERQQAVRCWLGLYCEDGALGDTKRARLPSSSSSPSTERPGGQVNLRFPCRCIWGPAPVRATTGIRTCHWTPLRDESSAQRCNQGPVVRYTH